AAPVIARPTTVAPRGRAGRRPARTVGVMGVLRLLDELPAAIARPPAPLWLVMARSLGEQGGGGRTALAWRWALTGGRPAPGELAHGPRRPPARPRRAARRGRGPGRAGPAGGRPRRSGHAGPGGPGMAGRHGRCAPAARRRGQRARAHRG